MVNLFIEKISYKSNKKFSIAIVLISLIQIFVYLENKNYIFILDVLVVFVSLFMYFKNKDKKYIMYPVCLCALITCLVSNYSEKLVSKEDISLQHNTYNYNILNKILENDENIYRVGNDIMGMKNINRVINSNYYLPSMYSSLENPNYYNLYVNSIGNEMENRISTAMIYKH